MESNSLEDYLAIEGGRLSSGRDIERCGRFEVGTARRVTSCHRWIFMGAVRGRSLYRTVRIRVARLRSELEHK